MLSQISTLSDGRSWSIETSSARNYQPAMVSANISSSNGSSSSSSAMATGGYTMSVEWEGIRIIAYITCTCVPVLFFMNAGNRFQVIKRTFSSEDYKRMLTSQSKFESVFFL